MAILLSDSYKVINWDLNTKSLDTKYWGKVTDSGRGCKVALLQNGVLKTPSTETMRVNFKKPSGLQIFLDGVVSGNYFVFDFTEQVFAEQGEVMAELMLNVGGEWLMSSTFYIQVDQSFTSAIESSAEFTALQTALTVVDEVKNDIVALEKPTFTEATTLANVNSGESGSTLWGKVKKWFSFVGTTTLTTTAQTVSMAINELNTDLDIERGRIDTITTSVVSGSPKGIYFDLTALNTAFPTGDAGNYILQSDGHIYNWSGSAWIDTGIQYQSTGISDKSVTSSKTDFATGIQNLIDYNALTLETRWNSGAGQSVLASSCCMNFVVEAGETYFGNFRIDFTYFFDGSTATLASSDSSYVGYAYTVNSASQFVQKITIPTGVTNLLVSFNYNTTYFRPMLFKDTTVLYPQKYYAFGEYLRITIPELYEPKAEQALLEFSKSYWYGKKGATFGDSITAYDGLNYVANTTTPGVMCKGYQSYAREKLGVTVDNLGTSGKYSTQIATTIKGTNLTGYDFITITTGTNDFGNAIPIGTLLPIGSTFNTSTFIGSLQSAIEYVLTNYPSCRIFLMTGIWGWFNPATAANPQTGEITSVYADALIEIANLYHFPILDWYRNAGTNIKNKDYYYADLISTTYQIHPNNILFEIMGNQFVEFLKRS